MKIKSNNNIKSYIGTRAIALSILLTIIYSLTISEVYKWGIDDNTHYFLSLEVDRASETLNQTGKFPLKPNIYTHYYLSEKNLPTQYLASFPNKNHINRALLTAEIQGDLHYLMPFTNPINSELSYLSHVYKPSDDLYDVGIEIPELLVLLAVITLILMAGLVKGLAVSIIKPVKTLETWALTITSNNNERPLPKDDQLKFIELQAVANQLNNAVMTIERKNQREKSFLRTLSHELRTPMAIIHAALDVFDQNKTRLGAGDIKKLERIRRANNNMQSTTESLLWLWTDKERQFIKESTLLLPLVKEIVSSNQYLLVRKAVNVHIEINEKKEHLIEKKLLDILLRNLIRNAFQYTEDGLVSISGSMNEICITNTLIGIPTNYSLESNAGTDYGYGVGLYLAQTLCDQLNWGIDIDHQDDLFSVRIKLPPS